MAQKKTRLSRMVEQNMVDDSPTMLVLDAFGICLRDSVCRAGVLDFVLNKRAPCCCDPLKRGL